jgi:hypothetical protein
MKALFFFVAFCSFLAGQAIGQQLAPVEAGFHWGPFVVLAVVGLVVAGLVLWHKRNPSKADAAIHDALAVAKADASELAHKVADAVHTLAKTNAQQAVVIASAPVQAAINAGTAPQPVQTATPTAQNAPEATITPTPAPVPQPEASTSIAASMTAQAEHLRELARKMDEMANSIGRP